MNFSLGHHGRQLWRSYERALHKRPVATQMTTSALLWGTGDFLAQRLVEKASWEDVDKRRMGLTAGTFILLSYTACTLWRPSAWSHGANTHAPHRARHTQGLVLGSWALLGTTGTRAWTS